MKPFISLTVFGVFNYIIALTLIAAPWLFGLVDVSSAALFLPIYLGWLQLIMAIFSDTPVGFLKQLPVNIHMAVYVFMGFVLLISPWLWNFSDKVFLPELLIGGLLIFLGIFSEKSPFLTPYHPGRAKGQLTSGD